MARLTRMFRFPGECLHAVNEFGTRLTLFKLPAYVCSEGCLRTFQQPIDSGTTAKRTFAVVAIHSEANRLAVAGGASRA